ncbi:bi-domain-containing oxidoreductase [bacterium]|nr:bi-domain-containing oxidoreductase [bacterium]
MKQVFLRDGKAVVEEIPPPTPGADEVLVKVVRSCISTGTELSGITAMKPPEPVPEAIPEAVPEQPVVHIPLWKQILTDPGMWERAIKDPRKIVRFLWRLFVSALKWPINRLRSYLLVQILTSPGMWKRAIKDPRKILRFLGIIRERGLEFATTSVAAQISVAYPLGYSAAGIVLETGENIRDISPGDRVACAGAQCAHHAEYIVVPRNLLVPVPDSLDFDTASTVALGSIAMQGVRRAQPEIGETFVVIGLGLLGQMTVQLLKANGCRVIGTDLDPQRIDLAKKLGMNTGLYPGQGVPVELVNRLTGGTGADCVIITASGPSAILATAFQMCRRKGRVVLVGDVAITISRGDIYRKELDFFISTSYGPGRYDARYEEKGIDYPPGYVRWTENRNMMEYLRLAAEKKISVGPLIQKVFPVETASDAYFTLKYSPDKPLIALLSYPEAGMDVQPGRKIPNPEVHPVVVDKRIHVAVVGAGGFAKGIHLPNFKKLSEVYSIHAIADVVGHNAVATAKQFGAAYSTTDFQEVIEDPDIDAVFITTRHHLHALLTEKALRAGKHVFVEKPLSMDRKGLEAIRQVFESSGENAAPVLLTGFNRRFSPFARRIRELTNGRKNPMILNYRMNAGYIPLDHWVHGEEGGGRNIGEGCHIYDLFTYLVDARVTAIEAKSIRPATDYCSYRDNFAATMTFEDGSIATLTYTALGSAEYPKENLDVFCDGMVLVLDNYTTLTGYGTSEADISSAGVKGHFEEIQAFAAAISEKKTAPIPLWQQYQAMEIAFEVDRILAAKK